MIPYRPVLAALFLMALPAHATANEPAPVRVSADYSASVLIFEVGEITLSAELGHTHYRASAHVEAAGLAALFTDFEIDSEVAGQRSAAGPQPGRYAHIERTGRKRRDIEVTFDGGTARSVATPEFSSWGEPPASEADRTGVVDPMTATLLLSEMVSASGGEPCSGSIPVFDGKQRYNLRLTSQGQETIRTRAWRGEALVCDAYYEPLSGYDPEDWPTPGETRHPLRMWIAPIADGRAYLPVRLHTRAGFGGVTIEARRIRVSD
ncbi:DUF3108 domain-containing protein [Hyphobacterium marinum]|uniref:DUF3108 domain-containing protein n=1 Tax=Hyphobacterium marinum TaxID=3116574 RepID=A0ABU7LUV2_9PROT|nr:DUF3108 domain-containing protein [Hyphobacterium sp. Y6023]MEE2565338.1 DUF3108 domain-containing protein [Hyphobacterium sp. Y6023]